MTISSSAPGLAEALWLHGWPRMECVCCFWKRAGIPGR